MKALEHCGRQGFVAPPLDRSDFGRLSVTPTDNSMLSLHPFDRSKGDIGSMDFPWGSGKYCILHSDIACTRFVSVNPCAVFLSLHSYLSMVLPYVKALHAG